MQVEVRGLVQHVVTGRSKELVFPVTQSMLLEYFDTDNEEEFLVEIIYPIVLSRKNLTIHQVNGKDYAVYGFDVML